MFFRVAICFAANTSLQTQLAPLSALSINIGNHNNHKYALGVHSHTYVLIDIQYVLDYVCCGNVYKYTYT